MSELEETLASHGGDAEAAGDRVQQQVLDGHVPILVDYEIVKQGSRIGCTMTGMPSHLPSVSDVAPGSLVAGSLRVGDAICRINGQPALGVQLAQRLLSEATGTVQLQVHRRHPSSDLPAGHRAESGQEGLRQRVKPQAAAFSAPAAGEASCLGQTADVDDAAG